MASKDTQARLFGNPPEYRQLNGGAHRKRATNFRAPALTWHLAFWNPPAPKSHTRLVYHIDSLILAFCRGLKKDKNVKNFRVTPAINDSIILFDAIAAKDTLTKKRNPHLSARQEDVRASDYRVVSIKYHWFSVPFTIRIELHTEYFSFTTFAELHSVTATDFNRLGNKLASVKRLAKSGIDPAAANELASCFYEDFWGQMTQGILSRGPLTKRLESDIFGNVFADFRGIILSNDTASFKFSDRKDGVATWGHDAEKAFRPLVTNADRYEYTASYMLEGRAFYMTALGPQRPEDHDNRRIPLTYLLYVNQEFADARRVPINKWQLGRLVDRMHLLGTMRLAGLRDFIALREAGHTLSKLDPYVIEARDSVAAHRKSGPKKDAIASIENAHRHFNEITKKFSETTKSRPGLLYRIERSRYYAEQFRSNIRALRLGRIEGSQRYDEFVDRRLGAVYDYIDRLGLRYERAINSLLMLDQNYLAIRTNKIEGDLKEIQRYADLALIAALLPYYVLGLISHLLPKESPFLHELTIWGSSLCFAWAAYRFVESNMANKILGAFAAFAVAATIWTALPTAQKAYDASHPQPSGSDSNAGSPHNLDPAKAQSH